MATTAAPAAAAQSDSASGRNYNGSVQLFVAGRRYLAPVDQLRRASPVFARMLSPEWAPQSPVSFRRQSQQFLVLHEAPDCASSFGQFIACLLDQNKQLPLDWPRLAGVLLLADKYLADGVRLACEAALCDLLLTPPQSDAVEAVDAAGDALPWWLAEFAGLRWLRLGRACSVCLRLAASRLPSLLSDCQAGRAFLASLLTEEFARLLADSETNAAADALIAACESAWQAVADDDSVRACLARLLPSSSSSSSSSGSNRANLLQLLSGWRMRRLRQLRPSPVDAEWRLSVAAAAAAGRWFRLRLAACPTSSSQVGRMSHDSRLFYTVTESDANLSVQFHFLPAASGCVLWAAPVEKFSGCPLELHRLTVPSLLSPTVPKLRMLDYACWGHAGSVEVLPDCCDVSLPPAAVAASDDSGKAEAWMLVCLERNCESDS